MKKIGIISDTHGCFDQVLMDFLSPVDQIWHAGDIGSIELADIINAFRPLVAVHGNIDNSLTRTVYRRNARFVCEGVNVMITHIGGHQGRYDRELNNELIRNPPKMLITGHSHILRVGYDNQLGFLHINPGAAGCSGFHAVRTAIRVTIDGSDIRDLEVGEWPRG